jgi:hypothetical protein
MPEILDEIVWMPVITRRLFQLAKIDRFAASKTHAEQVYGEHSLTHSPFSVRDPTNHWNVKV